MTFEEQRRLALEAEAKKLREIALELCDVSVRLAQATKRIDAVLADRPRPRDVGDLTMDELARLSGGI